jgi:hypothetical protein
MYGVVRGVDLFERNFDGCSEPAPRVKNDALTMSYGERCSNGSL